MVFRFIVSSSNEQEVKEKIEESFQEIIQKITPSECINVDAMDSENAKHFICDGELIKVQKSFKKNGEKMTGFISIQRSS